jgi:hypothetical protein
MGTMTLNLHKLAVAMKERKPNEATFSHFFQEKPANQTFFNWKLWQLNWKDFTLMAPSCRVLQCLQWRWGSRKGYKGTATLGFSICKGEEAHNLQRNSQGGLPGGSDMGQCRGWCFQLREQHVQRHSWVAWKKKEQKIEEVVHRG